MAKKKLSGPERPSIYHSGEVQGPLALKCADTFAAAVDECRKRHGRAGVTAYEAAKDLLQGFAHLTETHKLSDSTAYRYAAAQVKEHRNLPIAAFKAAVDIAYKHGQQGQQIQDAALGRSPSQADPAPSQMS